MSDILSQAEIDDLLNALIAGEEPEKKTEAAQEINVRAYDFRTANRFPKEQIRTFTIVFQNFAQLFSNLMTATLRSACECELITVEEMSFNEFNNSLPSPVILMVFEAQPMKGSLLMEISPECGYMIINRLLGGSSVSSDSGKQFTEIDQALLRKVLEQLLQTFTSAWDKILNVHTEIELIETSPQFAQVYALSEPVAVVTLNLHIGEESGLFSICIAHSAVEPIAKQLNTRMYYQTGNAHDTQVSALQSEQIVEKLKHSQIPMYAFFNDTPATVVDIINLQVGDVIRLNHRADDPLKIMVQHIPKFLASVGTSGNNYALKITDIIREEEKDESFARRN